MQQKTARDLGETLVPLLLLLLLPIPISETLNHGAFWSRSQGGKPGWNDLCVIRVSEVGVVVNW